MMIIVTTPLNALQDAVIQISAPILNSAMKTVKRMKTVLTQGVAQKGIAHMGLSAKVINKLGICVQKIKNVFLSFALIEFVRYLKLSCLAGLLH